MKLKFFIIILCILSVTNLRSAHLLVQMDKSQKNHLKAYGITYWALQNGISVKWLLNYRGGSFLMPYKKEIENECKFRGISYEIIADVQASAILSEISSPSVNMDAVKLETVPKIAVYSPSGKMPWDDAVTLALTYAEIPYKIIYDKEIIRGDLSKYDWLHLHHEDFTGQYGRFYASHRNNKWYKDNVKKLENLATELGFNKVSKLKLFVVKTIKAYVSSGGFLFAMCSATDTYDIALASHNTDICEKMFDGDPADKNAQ